MRLSFIATLSLTAASIAGATDRINLKNGDLFFGKVTALKDGLIEVETQNSVAPLKILNKNLVTLDFAGTPDDAATQEELPKNSQEVFLRNGDSFPGEVVGLSETHLSFQTWFTGLLEIPREEIDSVFFGVTPQRIIFSGPAGLESWTQGDNSRWQFAEGSFTAREKGSIGRDLNLPENFIIRTEISWESTPNMRFHLCTKSAELGEEGAGSSYLITINSSGVSVKRVMPKGAKGPKYMTLFTSQKSIKDKKNKTCQIELRVDRATKSLQLYLDDEKIGQGIDPADPPKGTSLIYESMSAENTISMVKVHEWDTTTQLLRREARAEDDLDTLSVDDGDRFSGKILSFDPSDPAKIFTVKTELSPTPLSIPLANCAVIYFTKGEKLKPSKGQYQLTLRTGGKLLLSGIQLGAEKLTATHPWLGQLEIDRRVMESISRSN